MWDSLLKSIATMNINLSADEVTFLCSLFRHKKFRKNQYILQQGDVTRYETLIITGLTRTYLVDEKGQEHVISFGAENWWVGDLYSYFTQLPTSYNVDCLEPTEVLQISLADLERLYIEVPQMNIYFRILYRNSIVSYNNRVASTLCKSAMERYQEFVQKYPHIDQRVPNHQIASYLGITPQSLSRLRKLAVSSKKLT